MGLLLRKDFKARALYPAWIAGEIKEKCRLCQDVDVRILDERLLVFFIRLLKVGGLFYSGMGRKG